MPDSGSWASEHVFSIPLAPGADSRSPGLVVFECSPLHGLEDEIEKCVVISGSLKRVPTHLFIQTENTGYLTIVRAYVKRSRCSPRTDILSRLCCSYSGVRTRRRHCLLICIVWYAHFYSLKFFDHAHAKQVGDYATKGVIGSHATFSLSSKTTDLDDKFTEILGSMDLDTAGGLVEILSRQGKLTRWLFTTDLSAHTSLRVPAGGHCTLEGLCPGLGGEVFH